MATWEQFARAEPELAAYGWELLREEQGYAYLASVTAAGSPRVHPVVPFIVDGALFVAVVAGSPKAADLRRDGRYMLHATVGDNDTEFAVRGAAREVIDLTEGTVRERQELNVVDLHAATTLFSLDIDRVDAAIWDDGPPHRQTWRDGAGEAAHVTRLG